MEKIPGSCEHLSMFWHAVKEARAKKSNLAVIWLDIANAYGFIPHKLVLLYIDMVSLHSGSDFSKSFSKSTTSAWHKQRGLFAGCTLSTIFFLAGMNIILEYSIQTRNPKFSTNNTTLTLLRTFMDDLSLMTTKVSGAQTLLSQSITTLTWAGLEFRADKSCSLSRVDL